MIDLGVAIAVPFDTAIDGQVHRLDQPVAFAVEAGLHMRHFSLVIEQVNAFSNERHRGFEQTSVDGHRPVFGHCTTDHGPKVILEIGRRCSNALHIVCKPLPGGASGG